jgi:hypothetical protein
MLTPDQIICIPSKRNANGSIDIIMAAKKAEYFTALKLMTGLLGKPHLAQCQEANYFDGRNCQETPAE